MLGNMIALFITFLVCGIWHGAGWNFILWGALHGFMISFALLVQKPKTKFYKLLKINNTKFLKFIQVVITFHLIAFSFIIFRAPDLQVVQDMFSQIGSFFHGEVFMQFVEKLPIIFGLIVIGYILHFMPVKFETKLKTMIADLPLVGKAVLLIIVIWFAVQFKSADITPFIYFQF